LARQEKSIEFGSEMDNYHDVQRSEGEVKVAIVETFMKIMHLSCGLAKQCNNPKWLLA
jgi:hypothetical protein